MNSNRARNRRGGVTLIELCASCGVLAVLMGIGVQSISMARREAHLVEAVTKLRQVSTGLDLYYNRYGRYPRQGTNLATSLAPYVPNPRVFENNLMPEAAPGHTVSALYQEPTLEELDSPENYLPSVISADGHTIVILKSLGKVERVEGLDFDPWSLLSSFNAAGRELVITSTSTTQYGTRSNRGHGNNADSHDEDLPRLRRGIAIPKTVLLYVYSKTAKSYISEGVSY